MKRPIVSNHRIGKIARKKSLILLGILALAQYPSFSQAQGVTIKNRKLSISKVFEEIRKQCKCDFLYNENLIKGDHVIHLNVENASVNEVLDLCFKDQPLCYTYSNKTVVVSPKLEQRQKFIEIAGTVKNEKNQAFAGVTIRIKGTQVAVMTDALGRFKISVPDDQSILVISSVGYVLREIPVKNNLHPDISLKLDESMLDDVVVTGYQDLKKRSMTGSVSTVKMKDLETIYQPSVDKLLQGQVPGLTVMSTSGAPGAMPQIRIRGTATLSGNVQPLWVVDGIILDDAVNVSVDDIMTNRNLIASGIGGINVDDIETINVLKDAAATAIYGTKAANGVIVITSKKGKSGKTRINYSATASMGERPRIEDAYMMNSKERINVNMEMIDKGVLQASSSAAGQYGTVSDFERYFVDVNDRKMSWNEFESKVKELETVNTDWFQHLFRNSFSHRHNISISGGNEKTTFYTSGSFLDDQATAKGVGQQTYTGSAKIYTQLHQNIRLGVMFDVNARDNSSFFAMDSRENPFEWAIYTTRAQPAFDKKGNYSYFFHNDLEYNFLENREKGWRDSRNFGSRASVDLEWKFMKDLTFSSLFSYSKQSTTDVDVALEDSYFVRSRKKDYYSIVDYQAVNIWKDGGYRKGKESYNGSITFRNQLMYNPLFRDVHYLNVMVGQEIRKSKTQDETTEVYGYAHDRGHQQVPQFDLMKKMGVPYWKENLNESANLSYFGVANYTYDNRYSVSFNVRTDGSNRFGLKTNQLFQPLWAIGLNYQLKEESFLRDLDWISYLTLKGSYGSQGNVASQAYSDLVARIGDVDVDNPSNYLVIVAPKNPYLKWEKTLTSNATLEFGLWKRKLMGSVEVYNKKGTDLLGNKEVSQVTGFTQIQVNWATMQNRGVEFSLSSINVDNNNFRWSTNVNFGLNKNKVLEVYTKPTVTDLTNSRRSGGNAALVGYPIDGLWSYRYAGLNESGRAQFYTNKEGEKVLNGMTKVDGLEYSGTTMPTTQMGFTNTFTYKRMTLSGLFIGSFGNVMRLRNLSQGSSFGYPNATQNMSKEWVGRWRNSGDEAFTNIPVLEVKPNDDALIALRPNNGDMYDNSDLRTVKGSFVRLQNLSLSYDYFTPRLRAMGIQNIRLMAQGNNLYVWKNKELKGQDPEAQGSKMAYSNSNSVQVNFGNTYLPVPRSYSLTLSVQF